MAANPSRPFSTRRRLVAPWLVALLAGLSLLSGCGDSEAGASEKPAPPSATEHNDADVAFATGMIPHHAQALAMVDLTRKRPMDPELEALTVQIRDAQAPEVQTMVGWLTSWGEEIPATMRDHVHAHGSDTPDDMPMDDLPGMMSAEDMASLEESADAEFQELWLKLMIEHHEGAIAMAEDELAQGRFQPALDLAQAIIDGQTAEISTMEEMLAG